VRLLSETRVAGGRAGAGACNLLAERPDGRITGEDPADAPRPEDEACRDASRERAAEAEPDALREARARHVCRT